MYILEAILYTEVLFLIFDPSIGSERSMKSGQRLMSGGIPDFWFKHSGLDFFRFIEVNGDTIAFKYIKYLWILFLALRKMKRLFFEDSSKSSYEIKSRCVIAAAIFITFKTVINCMVNFEKKFHLSLIFWNHL